MPFFRHRCPLSGLAGPCILLPYGLWSQRRKKHAMFTSKLIIFLIFVCGGLNAIVIKIKYFMGTIDVVVIKILTSAWRSICNCHSTNIFCGDYRCYRY